MANVKNAKKAETQPQEEVRQDLREGDLSARVSSEQTTAPTKTEGAADHEHVTVVASQADRDLDEVTHAQRGNAGRKDRKVTAEQVDAAARRVAARYGDREVQQARRNEFRAAEHGNAVNFVGHILQELNAPLPPAKQNTAEWSPELHPAYEEHFTSEAKDRLAQYAREDRDGRHWRLIVGTER